jgi:hypothetical protein
MTLRNLAIGGLRARGPQPRRRAAPQRPHATRPVALLGITSP